MSFLGKFFRGSSKPESKAVTTENSIRQLREIESLLFKKQEFYEKKIEDQLNIARANAKKNERIARQALKRKQHYMKELQRIDGTLSTLEMQREALEGATTNMTVVQTMKDASVALKKAHQNMNIDQVHDMMDEIGEQQDLSREIAEAISNPLIFGVNVDDEEVNEEYDRILQENLDDKLLDIIPTPLKLPEVVTEGMEVLTDHKKNVDDDAMNELKMWAS